MGVTKKDVGTYAMLTSVQFIFGGFHVLAFIGMRSMNSFVFATLRIGMATPVLFLIAWIVDRFWPPLREQPILALLGTLGVTSNQVLFLLGLYFTNPINAAVTQPAIPVLTAIICVILRQERASWLKSAGILVCCGGCVTMLLMQNDVSWVGRNVVLGNILLFANCLAFAVYLVIQKTVLERIPAYTLTAWTFVYGLVGVLLCVVVDGLFFEHLNFAQNLRNQPAIAWIAVVYASQMATVVAYVMNTLGVKFSSATTAAVFVPFQPVASTMLSVIFLHKVPTVGEYVGAAGIVSGLLAVTYARHLEEKSKSELADLGEVSTPSVTEKLLGSSKTPALYGLNRGTEQYSIQGGDTALSAPPIASTPPAGPGSPLVR